MTNPTKGTDPINPMTMEHFQLGLVGLTKREHFAALAMQGMLSASYEGFEIDVVAKHSVTMADALINALNKPKND